MTAEAETPNPSANPAVGTPPPPPPPVRGRGRPVGRAAGPTRAETLARALLAEARPKQWSKNVLVFAAPAAAGVLEHGRPLLRSAAVFVLFCLLSSATYLLNDVADRDKDRLHPVKRYRPVAAGTLATRDALIAAFALGAIAIGAGTALRWQLGVVLALYGALQVAYSLRLKQIAVYELTSVAAGFVLRAIAGAVAVPVVLSQWFLVVTTFGCLLVVSGKRLAEQTELGTEGGRHRATLEAYSSRFLWLVVSVSAAGAVIGYALWALGLQAAAVSVHHHDGIYFQLSIVPVLLGLLRYAMAIDQGRAARPEDLVHTDRHLQVLGAVWLLLFALGVYA